MYRIRTPSTVLGVRGTRFRASAAPAGDELAVAKGVVEVKDGPAVGARRAMRWYRAGGAVVTDLNDAACGAIEVEHGILPVDDMSLVPSGEYPLGDDDGEVSHDGKPPRQPHGIEAKYNVATGYSRAGRLHVEGFLIDREEVSLGAYLSFRASRGGAEPLMPGPRPLNPRLPVFGIPYEDATRFADWIGKRLPTCPEWEAAGRGLDFRWFPWGNTIGEEHRALMRDTWWPGANGTPGQWASVDDVRSLDEATVDVSPFGIRGLVSSAPEFVASPDPSGSFFGLLSYLVQLRATKPEWHIVRGTQGSLISYYFVGKANTAGFRCARSLPQPRR